MLVSWLRTISLALLSIWVIGCGGGTEPRRVAVRGSVIATEKLVAEGTIRFLPQAGNPSPIAITSVKGGLYSFTKDDGPYPGKYTVAVNLELSLDSLKSISQSSEEAPTMNWEQADVTVPDQDTMIQHFLWAERTENGTSSSKTTK